MTKKFILGVFAVSLLIGSGGYAKFSPDEENEQPKKSNFWDKLLKKDEKKKAKEERKHLQEVKSELEEQEHAIKVQTRKLTLQAEELEADQSRTERKAEILEKKEAKALERENLMQQYKLARLDRISKKYALGKYADLYKLPTWPFYAQFAKSNDLFNVTGKFNYADEGFTGDGSTQELSRLVFGESSIQLKDILLVSKLLQTDIAEVTLRDPYGGWTFCLDTLKDAAINFRCSTKEYGLSLDFMRYIKDKDVAVGFQVPFGYKKNKIKATLCSEIYDSLNQDETINKKVKGNDDDNNFQDAEVYVSNHLYQGYSYFPTQYSYLFGSDFNTYLNYILEQKGIRPVVDRSVTGIGDVSMFANFAVNCRYFEQLAFGARLVLPTAKAANPSKLFSPELGNGGFTQVGAYMSALFNGQRKWFNPHMFFEVDYTFMGHADKRVPKHVNLTVAETRSTPCSTVMVMGDYVNFNEKAIDDYDTLIPAFADNIVSVKMRPGAQFNLRLGNMFEKFILRRGFLDIYYDLVAKIKDHIGGNLPRDIWYVDLLKNRTDRVSNKLGLDYSYQFDKHARLRLGGNFTFFGINVPQTFEFNFTIGTEF